ncbi:MAG: hypothetical protein EKK29_01245 [Hyphomicrobiales bacterium]|nr:MAG: hypothetical protein EKK29_01245 [Hyphomicrobiales bacterium]
MHSPPIEKKSRPYFPHVFLEEHAEQAPGSIAIVFRDRRITYGQLDREAHDIGQMLAGEGVGPNVVVGLYMPRSPELIFAVMGIYKSGGACAFLRFDDSSERTDDAIAQLRPRLILSTRSCLPRLHNVSCRVICLDELDRETVPSQSSFTAPACATLSENDVASVFLTSGSRGKPKAVPIPFGRIPVRDRPQSGQHRYVLKTDSGTTFTRAEIVHPILAGGAVYIAPLGMERDAGGFVEYLIENEITHLISTPTFLQLLTLQDNFRACKFLRSVICSGETVPGAMVSAFFQKVNAELTIVYGCTEAPSISSLTLKSNMQGVISVGKPSEFTEIHILDENMRPVPMGEEGEICVGGSIAKGYLDDPALADEKFFTYFDQDKKGKRLFRTGDIGKWLQGGDLQIIGRRDDQVKVRGYRFHLSEIENRILEHPGVRVCAVVDHEHEIYGKRIVGFYGRKSESNLRTDDLRRFLRQLVPPEMIPHTFIEVSDLPLTANGKIDRSELRRRPAVSSSPLTSFQGPDALERLVVCLWERVIEHPIRDADVNFFDLGGDSFSFSLMKSEFERQFGIGFPDIALSDLTIRRLTSALRLGQKRSAIPLPIPLKSGTRRPIFFAPYGYDQWGLGGCYFYLLTSKLDIEQPVYELAPPESTHRQPSIRAIALDCVKSIKAVQPQGPYILAGYSNGGVVAFDIAQLLAADGDTVERLILIDTYMPSAYHKSVWLKGIAATLKGKKVQLRSRMVFLIKQFFLGRWMSPSKELDKLNCFISRTYSPLKYHGRVDFLYAGESSSWRVSHDLLGWHGLLCGNVRLRRFEGNHLGPISMPVAAKVSEEIQRILESDD